MNDKKLEIIFNSDNTYILDNLDELQTKISEFTVNHGDMLLYKTEKLTITINDISSVIVTAYFSEYNDIFPLIQNSINEYLKLTELDRRFHKNSAFRLFLPYDIPLDFTKYIYEKNNYEVKPHLLDERQAITFESPFQIH
ncbi:hypothetical protein [Evansella cellulosilytica]|uniref:Uncharacterized protein n=1 Tax=Evansella cellulosilytica (strain ATCC 21833 / DSM 2522 / FERM P-1141 / JCM 9156 / N-4) TaxID=649639 RepID=E6TVF0_EVAC2|nr:hypothetical protein [Evansella cellulosilytica]ADU30967.1 hypothetical protein Bcell_2712 [Evansella cellulosilytica DSM 2522]